MTSKIHPSSIIDSKAEIAESVTIGPFCTIGPNVKIDAGTILKSHIVIDGHTSIGKDNKIFSFTALGLEPQHMQYKGEDSTLVIGDRNIIREGVSMHPGTHLGIMTTKVGDDNFFLASSHVAHDVVIGNNIVAVNACNIGGHAVIEDYVYMGAFAGVKPWVRIGKHAMVSAMTGVMADVIPYGNVFGGRAELVGLNLIGLKRRGFTKDQITMVRKAYSLMFAEEGTFAERLEEVRQRYGDVEIITDMLNFIESGGDRSLCHPAKR